MKFTHWTHHFEANKTHFDHIDWQNDSDLSNYEIQAIKKSIQHFQHGENSEGKNLIKAAERHFRNNSDQSYIAAIKLFIKEEQSHSRALGHFMDRHKIRTITNTWSDNLFRLIRKGGNLERAISVLVCAEILATVFYKAFRDATNSPVLKSVCKQILIDEEHHINFQAYTLSEIYNGRSEVRNLISRCLHFLLLIGATSTAYVIHRRLLKTTGFDFVHYATSCFKEFFRLQRMSVYYQVKDNVVPTYTKPIHL